MVTHPVRCVSCPRLVVGVCTPCVARLPSAVCRCALRHRQNADPRVLCFLFLFLAFVLFFSFCFLQPWEHALRACPSRSDAVRTSCGQAANDQGLPARSTRFRCQSSAVIELQHKRTLTAPGGIYTGLNASQDASAVARHPRHRGTTRSHGPRQARHDSSTPRLPRYSWASAGLPSMGMAQLKAEQEFPAAVGPALV